MSELLTKERVLEALKRVKGPDLGADLVSQGLVSEIVINKGKVYFAIKVDPARAGELEALRQAAESVVKALPGVEAVAVTLDRRPRARRRARRRQRQGPRGAARLALHAARRRARCAPSPRRRAWRRQHHRRGLRQGRRRQIDDRGQSRARPERDRGSRVGILDADIYGPSMPRLLGLKGQPQQLSGDKLAPMEAYGIKVMSMGFLVDEETPMIWRGPMVMSALSQMLKDVAWGELDVLVVDMPPGTGDAQLTMAQQVPLAGAVIVSTPQDLALIDARKGLNMFRKVNVPVLGIVENMSTFVCPHCGEPSNIFGHGGARAEAARLGVPFLGDVPLMIAIRETSDEGRPVVATDPSSPAAEAYREIAATRLGRA